MPNEHPSRPDPRARPQAGLRARRVDAHRRWPLTAGWSLAARPWIDPAGGEVATPAATATAASPTEAPPETAGTPAAQLRWHALERLAPVAAAGAPALRGVERLDGVDWCYHLRFDAPAGAETGPGGPGTWVLGFDGLATLAEVWLNGEAVLDSASMFVAHALPLGSRLKAQGNELVIVCRSVDRALAARRPRPRWRAPMVEHQQLRWLRTSLIGRTPGWSPALPPIGPWRDVWLERREAVQVEALQVHAELAGPVGRLAVQAELQALPGWGIDAVHLGVEREGRRWSAALAPRDEAAPAPAIWGGRLAIDAVRPWWPHTHGEPALYEAWLELVLRAADDGRRRRVRVALGPVGFRRIEREGDGVDGAARVADGEGFGLRVNGVPVFCRGACWTPLDVRRLRAEPAAVRAAVRQVRSAGMNMLRVAGPMVYEDEAFFDACDAEGVMVWQDFMFANMDYPARLPAADAATAAPLPARAAEPAEALGAWIALEVRQQLERWQARACLAVVCGNSEVSQQAAMWGAGRELWAPPLFHEDLPRRVEAWLPGTVYWPSSAHGGAWPFRPDTGTASYYGVGAYLRASDDARLSDLRFATECLAFAQVPGEAALARLPGGPGVKPHEPAWKAAVPRDLGAGWDFDDVRDHYLGQRHGQDPARWRGSDLPGYLAASRQLTGALMAAAFRQWRSAGSACRGALVWWLRDLQPGAGWGLLDELGEPKPAWHVLRRALQPTALLWQDGGLNGLDLQWLHEGPTPQAALLEILAWRADGVPLLQHTQPLTLAPRASERLALATLSEGFVDLTQAYGFGPPPCEGVVARLRDAAGQLLAEAFHWCAPAGRRKARIGLQATLQREPGGEAWLVVGSREAAWGVQISAPGYLADDDAFDLAPGGQQRVRLRPREAKAAQRPLTVGLSVLNADEVLSVTA